MKKMMMALVLIYVSGLWAAQQDRITQYGITWKFDKNYETGQFINGDWWVIGPVTVDSITPATVIKAITGGDSVANGSCLDPKPDEHGFDSRAAYFKRSLVVSLPTVIHPQASLVSAISRSESRPYVKTAAVLTVLDSVPAADAFRPPYCFGQKINFRFSQADTALLPFLAVPADGTPTNASRPFTRSSDLPDVSTVAANFQQPWIDLIASWHGGNYQDTRPFDAMDFPYSRDTANRLQIGAMALMVNSGKDRKPLLVNMLQIGIDYYGLALQNDSLWQGGDGQGNGRKWPIVFAGIIFHDNTMLGLEYRSGEEDQCYYYDDPTLPVNDYQGFPMRGVPAWTGPKVLFGTIPANPPHSGMWCRDYEHLHPVDWAKIRPGGDLGGCRSEGYRRCCTNICWVGQALTMHLMNGTGYWDPAWFHYVDRWMTEQYNATQLAELQSVYCNTADSTDLQDLRNNGYARSSVNRFIDAMWHTYRAPLTIFCGDTKCEGPVEDTITCPRDCDRTSTARLMGPQTSPADVITITNNPLIGSGQCMIIECTVSTRTAIVLYNSRGNLVQRWATPVSARQTIVWDGRDYAGNAVGNGVYYVMTEAQGKKTVYKVAVVR
jgi:hypothetical protein